MRRFSVNLGVPDESASGCFLFGYIAMASGSPRAAHLCVIVPWEGATEPYRELAFHCGIPETTLYPLGPIVGSRVSTIENSRWRKISSLRQQPTRWMTSTGHRKDLPSKTSKCRHSVCARWSDYGLHTRGSIEGFARISSRQKWLFTRGRKKWKTFYGEQGIHRYCTFQTARAT